MADFFEIDFLKIESAKSGDAISLRYSIGNEETIHVIDGGFKDTGDEIIKHIEQYYNHPTYIDRVILTHPDGDHAGGLQKVLEHFKVGELWMLCPWNYADELIDKFTRFTSVDNLEKRLMELYPNVAALEKIANDCNIPIYAPFQGEAIGEFIVMSPTKEFYLNMVVESDKTPEATKSIKDDTSTITEFLEKAAKTVINFIKALWGEEIFSDESTSSENEMSVVQFANLCNKKILLTGDAGRQALTITLSYAPYAGLNLPGIDRFQVPHHGSRRNLSTEILDNLFGERLKNKLEEGKEIFTAIISASEQDKDHPRKAVIRSMIHRGGKVVTNQSATLTTYSNAPKREGWSSAKPMIYPNEQEE